MQKKAAKRENLSNLIQKFKKYKSWCLNES